MNERRGEERRRQENLNESVKIRKEESRPDEVAIEWQIKKKDGRQSGGG